MNTQILNVQYSVFGDFKNLNPNNSEVVITLMNLFKKDDFVPSTFGEIPINTNKLVLQNRFSFSNKEGVTINIGSDRLDIIFGYNEDGIYKDMNIQEMSIKAIEYISMIIEKYHKSINRIALNINKFYDEIVSKEIEKKFEKCIFLNYYKTNTPSEWNQRLLYKLENKFLKEINIGLNINKTKGKLTKKNEEIEFDGIISLFDINTTYDPSAIYNLDDVKDFFKEAYEQYKLLSKDIEDK